ncbi:MAG: hypothetical protein ACD_39C00003G0001, partial [uncultured bacterium]
MMLINRRLLWPVIFVLVLALNFSVGSLSAETDLAGYTEDRIKEIEEAVKPVLKGEPVTELP